MGYVYDVLRAVGATEEDARKAAEEIAGYENRLVSIEQRLVMLQWMVSTVMAVVLLGFGATLAVLYRLASS